MLYAFPIAVVLLFLYFYSWYYPACRSRRYRVRRTLYQKMHEYQYNEYDLAEVMGVNVGFVKGLLTGNQRMDAVAADGLRFAFEGTDLSYWYNLDSL